MINKERFSDFISKEKSPAYVFDFDEFSMRAKTIKDLVGNQIGLCYSMKANPFFAQRLPNTFSRVEVCSHGEFKICKNSRIDPALIFYSGVNKNINEVEEAFLYGVRTFTVESSKQIVMFDSISRKYQTEVFVFPRVASDSQFGMEFKEIEDLIINRTKFPFINIKGLHYFTGTQKKKTESIEKEICYLNELIHECQESLHFKIDEIEYGTGLYIEYFGEKENDLADLKSISKQLYELSKIASVTIEMGRYFAATCGIYITKIDDIKTVKDTHYIIVNGGIHQMVYDGQLRGMRKPTIFHYKQTNSTLSLKYDCYTICGSLCTPNDVLVRDLELDNPSIDDFLAFYNVGAYSSMEGMSTFLSRDIPEVWGIVNGTPVLLRKSINTESLNCAESD